MSAKSGSERDWNFAAEPNPHLNGRAIPYSMGKVLGGGSSINVMAWARAQKRLGLLRRRGRRRLVEELSRY
jgi:choline dehydrogenase-like flavoprotein